MQRSGAATWTLENVPSLFQAMKGNYKNDDDDDESYSRATQVAALLLLMKVQPKHVASLG